MCECVRARVRSISYICAPLSHTLTQACACGRVSNSRLYTRKQGRETTREGRMRVFVLGRRARGGKRHEKPRASEGRLPIEKGVWQSRRGGVESSWCRFLKDKTFECIRLEAEKQGHQRRTEKHGAFPTRVIRAFCSCRQGGALIIRRSAIPCFHLVPVPCFCTAPLKIKCTLWNRHTRLIHPLLPI